MLKKLEEIGGERVVDAFIGAVCLIYDLILITRNIKDFQKIIGLKIFIPY
jgi:predicted nucleic acid-binding protein